MPDCPELEAYLLLLATAKPTPTIRRIAAEQECWRALANPKKYHLTIKSGKLTGGARLVARQMDWLAANPTVRTLHITEPAYPALLKSSPDPPAWLFCRGNLKAINQLGIAVIGSRQATRLSEELTHSISMALSKLDVCIISGMAKGVDAAAHRGALQASGMTVAVFGCGLDKIYPAGHRNLAAEITKRGACISEYPPMTEIKKYYFPERNRIIAGMSEGVVIIEAGIRSGSLITARLALEAGRELFVVPGNIWSERYQGCNLLLKRGAKLVQNLQDIVEEIPALQDICDQLKPHQTVHATERPAHEKTVLKALAHQTRSIETIAVESQTDISAVISILTSLELEGLVIKQASGYRLPGKL